jgi:hypothetical protein
VTLLHLVLALTILAAVSHLRLTWGPRGVTDFTPWVGVAWTAPVLVLLCERIRAIDLIGVALTVALLLVALWAPAFRALELRRARLRRLEAARWRASTPADPLRRPILTVPPEPVRGTGGPVLSPEEIAEVEAEAQRDLEIGKGPLARMFPG